ncbi:hypothetical protein IMY05_005G0052800 [Salix suchowensis]|nr:hypothetical protein IMY05_005G0052800 [Salix suchowensis]
MMILRARTLDSRQETFCHQDCLPRPSHIIIFTRPSFNNRYDLFFLFMLFLQMQTVAFGGNGNDAGVPDSDVKRMRI